jgi:class 3 adenylate cyclase/HAMP domain-containing protein
VTRGFPLFVKYAALIIAVVGGLLLASGFVHYRWALNETQAHLHALQLEKASSAAAQIKQFILDIDRQLGWVELPPSESSHGVLQQMRNEYLKLMRQQPALTQLSWIGADGFERLAMSRIEPDRFDSRIDWSSRAGFQEAVSGRSHYGVPYFFQDSEPYMALSRPVRGGGVVSAEVNLKFIWDTVLRASHGKNVQAYVVDSGGTLIAHPDIALVLKKVGLQGLPQALALRQNDAGYLGRNFSGDEVFFASATIPTLGWTVFVESPWAESQAVLDQMMTRTAILLATGILIAAVVSFLLARTMVKPLRALQDGAARIGSGDFDHRIVVSSGDELEVLAEQFNRMGAGLKDSYAQLEQKVIERTAELQQEQLRANQLLHNILPEEIAGELARTGKVRPVRHESVSILFTDFSGFTQAAATMPADRIVAELNEIFAEFDAITDRHGVEKIKTIGDAYMAAGGLPLPCDDHAQRCVRAGLAMLDFVKHRNESSAFKWSLRVGVHSGPVVAGVVGARKYAFDVWGDTVNVASRVESAGKTDSVNVSAYTCDLIRDEFECEYRGKIEAKGKGVFDMYFVKGPL